MTNILSDNEQTIDNQKGKADTTADTKWTFNALSQCEPSKTPHEPLEISLMRGYIEDAYAAMQSNDYQLVAHLIRIAAFLCQRDVDRRWAAWPPKD
jgi:hypothetical protein